MNASTTPHCVTRIVSGGQTGVDRGALLAALDLEIEHGGWCPKGRRAEDGVVPTQFQLQETESRKYWVRTERNVVESDGTLILYRQQLTGGTELTRVLARKHGKPHFLGDLAGEIDRNDLMHWLTQHGVSVLNVAGPRESGAPGIANACRDFLVELLAPSPR